MQILKTLSIAAGMAFMAANVSAQGNITAPKSNMPASQGNMPSSQQMAQKQTDRIKQNVTGITPDQESKILAVEQDFTKGMMDARTNSNGNRDAMRSKMEPLRQDRDAKIKAILTSDQYAQYEKMAAPHQMGGKKSGN